LLDLVILAVDDVFFLPGPLPVRRLTHSRDFGVFGRRHDRPRDRRLVYLNAALLYSHM
jgi:hypothetical protein